MQVIGKDMRWKTKTLQQYLQCEEKQNWSQHGPLRYPKIQIKRRYQNAMNQHLLTPPRQVRRKPIQCITSNTKANIQPLQKYGMIYRIECGIKVEHA